MKKQSDIVPARDTQFDIFQEDVYNTSDANKASWAIPQITLDDLKVLKDNWTAAWDVAKDKGNRTKQQTAAKNEARATYEESLRPFLQSYIQFNPLVSNAAKEGMGIKPRSESKTKAPIPNTIPVLMIKPGTGSMLKLFYKQEPQNEGVSGRGKPVGVKFCEVVYKIGGTTPPVTPAECDNTLMMSKSNVAVTFAPEQVGQKVYFFARWLNTLNEPGMWNTLPVSAFIPG